MLLVVYCPFDRTEGIIRLEDCKEETQKLFRSFAERGELDQNKLERKWELWDNNVRKFEFSTVEGFWRWVRSLYFLITLLQDLSPHQKT